MGGRGGGPSAFGMGSFRKDCGGGPGRGLMNEPRPPLMPVNLGVQVNTHEHVNWLWVLTGQKVSSKLSL